VDHRGLRPRLRRYAASARQAGLARQQRFYRAEQRDADKGDDLRFVAPDLLIENLPAFDVLCRREIVDSRARARDQIRDPEPELRQPRVVLIRDRLRHEP
jgi:hypothetical protein